MCSPRRTRACRRVCGVGGAACTCSAAIYWPVAAYDRKAVPRSYRAYARSCSGEARVVMHERRPRVATYVTGKLVLTTLRPVDGAELV